MQCNTHKELTRIHEHTHTHSLLLQAALEEANRSLEETKRALAKAKARLQEVEEGIAMLQARYEDCVAKKEDLAEKCALCTARLERAEKVCRCGVLVLTPLCANPFIPSLIADRWPCRRESPMGGGGGCF